MIFWTKKAPKRLEELDEKTRDRILSAVSSLPFGDIKPLKVSSKDCTAYESVHGELSSPVKETISSSSASAPTKTLTAEVFSNMRISINKFE